jgi:hypothetical protein
VARGEKPFFFLSPAIRNGENLKVAALFYVVSKKTDLVRKPSMLNVGRPLSGWILRSTSLGGGGIVSRTASKIALLR